MHITTSLILLSIIALIQAQTNDPIACYPTGVVNNATFYIFYSSNAYKYSIPTLNLEQNQTYNQLLCAPVSYFGNDTIVAAGDRANTNSTYISTDDLSIAGQNDTSAPYQYTFPTQCISNGTDEWCYNLNFTTTQVSITHTNYTDVIYLPINATNVVVWNFDSTNSNETNTIAYIATTTSAYRSSSDYTIYQVDLTNSSIVAGPIALNYTRSSGCPVQPSGCGVPVLLYFNADYNAAVYIWSIAEGGFQNEQFNFTVTVESYDFKCGNYYSVRLGESSNYTYSLVNGTCPGNDTSVTAAPVGEITTEALTEAPEEPSVEPAESVVAARHLRFERPAITSGSGKVSRAFGIICFGHVAFHAFVNAPIIKNFS
ncbi:hypothetical protein AKO1_011638 [Acrasis kona]|uniref:Uncharacterized protein n=1 Tax=Acrasis kona TaxID=1008807 RepID=A0AAW2Z4L8_9EUKA